jgi:hypothetical protein
VSAVRPAPSALLRVRRLRAHLLQRRRQADATAGRYARLAAALDPLCRGPVPQGPATAMDAAPGPAAANAAADL